MIKRLKTKFILLSTVSILSLLTVILLVMNLVNYHTVVNEADRMLELISQNHGTFPGVNQQPPEPPASPFPENPETPSALPNHISKEMAYQLRYFSVLLSESGEVLHIDTRFIASVDAAQAESFARDALASGKAKGFTDLFRYRVTPEEGGTRITFLNWETKLESFFNFFAIGVLISSAGFLLVFVVICLISKRIMRPIAEGYEKQKRFITDAGHEIKTPLTIINANVDILEMEMEENESLMDIRQQTKRLTDLTNDLIYLARMQEADESIPMIDFPVSEVVQETADDFKAPALASNKALRLDIAPFLTLHGNEKAIRQLVSILLDNAIKYSSEQGEIELALFRQNRSICLSVQNVTDLPLATDEFERIFDRFYRPDPSRNSQTGGHGIGLSVAHAIVTSHNGKISVSAPTPNMFCITAVFPAA